jgi:hypothetical protein
MISKDKIIQELENEIETLREENESLWFLLEELQNSNKALFDQNITKALIELRTKSLMTVSKVAEG